MPFDLAAQRYPAIPDLHLHFLVRDSCIPGDDLERTPGDLVVGGLDVAGHPDLYLLGDGTDALDPADDSFGHDLFGIAPDISGQGNDPVTDGDPDILRVHAHRLRCRRLFTSGRTASPAS
jgi:hypothetical protein